MDVDILYIDSINDHHIAFSDALTPHIMSIPDLNVITHHCYSLKEFKKKIALRDFDAVISALYLKDGSIKDIYNELDIDIPLILFLLDPEKERTSIPNTIMIANEGPDYAKYYNIANILATLAKLKEGKSRLFAQKRENEFKEKCLGLLQSSSRKFSEHLDLRALYMELYGLVKEELPMDSMTISSYDPESKKIKAEFMIHGDDEVDVRHFPLLELSEEGKGTQSKVIRTGRSLIINDYFSSIKEPTQSYYFNGKRTVKKTFTELKPKSKLSSFSTLYVPVKIDEKTHGVVYISSHDRGAYCETHRIILELLVQEYAIAKKQIFKNYDITKNERKFSSLFENAPICYHSLDKNGIILDVNKEWLETLGYDKDFCIGKRFELFMTPYSSKRFSLKFPTFMSEGHIMDLELELQTKDGELISCIMDGNIVYDENMKMTRAYCTLKKISIEKGILERLRLSKNSIDNAGCGIYWADPEGRLVYVNDHFCHSLGYSQEDMMEMKTYDIDILESEENRAEVWKRTKEEGVRVFKSIHRSSDGSEYSVLVTSQYITFMDKELEFSIAMDITELEMLEGGIENLYNELQLVHSELEDYVSSLYHVLQSPLATINGYIELLDSAMKEGDKKSARKYMGIIKRSSNKLSKETKRLGKAVRKRSFQ